MSEIWFVRIVVAVLLLLSQHVFAGGGFFPVIYIPYNCLLGGVAEGKWVDGKKAAGFINGKSLPYRLFAQSGRVVEKTCGAPDPDPESRVPGRVHDFTVRCNTDWEGADADLLIGTGTGINPFPRAVAVVSGQPKIYTDAVRNYLQATIPNANVRIDKIVRADVDGNGTDEILIAASNFEKRKLPAFPKDDGPLPIRGKPGWYSIVLMRQLVGGQVVTEKIAGVIYKVGDTSESVFTLYSISGLFDVNGDGWLELLLSDDYYEGGYTHVIQLDKKNKRTGELGEVIASCDWGA